MKNLVFKKLIYPVIASILLFSTTSLSFASEKNPDVWKIPTDNYSKSIDILQKYENGELCEFNGSFTYPNNLSSAAYTEMSFEASLTDVSKEDKLSDTYSYAIYSGIIFIGVGISAIAATYQYKKKIQLSRQEQKGKV